MNEITWTLPDGTEYTVTSSRSYTHAVAIRRGDEWSITSVHGNEIAAIKKSRTWNKPLHNPIDEYRILNAH